jgi:hypothetical protein
MRKDGSEGTPSMGSSFSDLDGMFLFFLSFFFSLTTLLPQHLKIHCDKLC